MGPRRQQQPIEPRSDDFDWLLSIGPFRVPRYQRAFDWDVEEVRDFARDCRTLVEQRIAGERGRHFFGAVISIFYKSEHYYEIVDGQQRMATEILCLHELRRRLTELAKDAQKAGRRSIPRKAREHVHSVGDRLADGNGPRLTMSKRDEQFFNDLLAETARKPKRGASQSHRRLWAAQETLRSELFDVLLGSLSDHGEILKRLLAIEGALLEDGYIVHLYTEQRGEAYRLFSVLNDRGRPLSDGSLLRTHTLAILEDYPQQQASAEEDWDSILKIGDRFVNSFLAAYYVSHVGVRAPTGDMFDRFRGRFLVDDVQSARDAIRLRNSVAKLRDEMETYSRIQVGDWPFDEPRTAGWDRDRLKRLIVSIRHNLAHPLLLAVARNDNEKAFRDLVLMLEPFVFRYINIVNASPARLAAVYYEHAKKVRRTGCLDKNGLRRALRKLTKDHAGDEVFVPLMRDQLRYARTAARRQLIKHFLTTIDDYEDWFKKGAAGKRVVNAKASVYDLDQVNIEHIYPQNPQHRVAELDNMKHELGNLTLLDDRDGMLAGNQVFAVKKPIYRTSKFTTTKPLAQLRQWGPAEIDSRAAFYSERAVKIFVVE